MTRHEEGLVKNLNEKQKPFSRIGGRKLSYKLADIGCFRRYCCWSDFYPIPLESIGF